MSSQCIFPPDTSIDYPLNSFFACYYMARKFKRPRESKLIGMLTASQPVADSGSALQAWGNEENNCTLLLAHNPLGYTDTLFFSCWSSFCCNSYIAPPTWQNPGPKTWMSPELAQPGSAAGRRHSHWGTRVEHRATCKKPISIPCIL